MPASTDLTLLHPADPEPAGIQADTPAFRRTSKAMFIGGFATFGLLYYMQPLMPVFSASFHISPAEASGAMSVATGALALALIPASIVADRYGRKPLMTTALALAALFTIAAAFAGSYGQLLVLRALQGVAMAGLPAVAMAYLSEEVDAAALGRSMGLYIAGNALGGMSGRLVASVLTEWTSWRVTAGVIGLFGIWAAWEFRRSLPASRRFKPSPLALGELWAGTRAHFSDSGLPWLFCISFLLMGCCVSLYNYLGYRLAEPPFSLRPSLVGAVFGLYLVGMFASAWVGRLADQLGRRNVLWITAGLMAAGLALTLADHLLWVIIGIAVFTFGFFGSHSVASNWVGRRAMTAKGLASALYLGCYYLGASVLGSASGLLWQADGWTGVAALLGAALLICVGIALRLRSLAPKLVPTPVTV